MDIHNQKAAMFVAHPGHVLRAFHWMELAKPVVFALTDGSGLDHPSQLPSTTTLLDKVGALQGAIYGRWTDKDVYEAFLKKDTGPFVKATREIADVLAAGNIDYVAGDACEGHSSTHDLCRYMVNSAIALVEMETGRRIPNFEFLLFGPPNTCPDEVRDRSVHVELDEAAFERKMAAAHSYHADFTREVTQQIEKYGREPFMIEYLMPTEMESEPEYLEAKPAYELWGESQVANGKYKDVIRYREHLRPFVRELRACLGLGPAVGKL